MSFLMFSLSICGCGCSSCTQPDDSAQCCVCLDFFSQRLTLLAKIPKIKVVVCFEKHYLKTRETCLCFVVVLLVFCGNNKNERFECSKFFIWTCSKLLQVAVLTTLLVLLAANILCVCQSGCSQSKSELRPAHCLCLIKACVIFHTMTKFFNGFFKCFSAWIVLHNN